MDSQEVVVFHYLACDVSYNYGLNKKISMFQHIYCTISRILEWNVPKVLKLYSVLAVPTLICYWGLEIITFNHLLKNLCIFSIDSFRKWLVCPFSVCTTLGRKYVLLRKDIQTTSERSLWKKICKFLNK